VGKSSSPFYDISYIILQPSSYFLFQSLGLVWYLLGTSSHTIIFVNVYVLNCHTTFLHLFSFGIHVLGTCDYLKEVYDICYFGVLDCHL
jgi:hypothetical protein